MDFLTQHTTTVSARYRRTRDMHSLRDKRLKASRALRERVRRHPEKFVSFPGELHKFLMELYEAAAPADENDKEFVAALAALCRSRGIDRWEDSVAPDLRQHFIKDAEDPLAQRIIAFWSEVDEPLVF